MRHIFTNIHIVHAAQWRYKGQIWEQYSLTGERSALRLNNTKCKVCRSKMNSILFSALITEGTEKSQSIALIGLNS